LNGGSPTSSDGALHAKESLVTDFAVRVEGLCKEYVIGGREGKHRTFRESIADGMAAPLRRMRAICQESPPAERFWALDDVSLDVEQGEVVGIIGRNGAGKSTLLKILSRITAPTKGRVEIRGRVASLLEVGTGFHPELTGRENIYLNGVILGMSRAEIARKFDEIVAFADIAKFLDTPVKRYSSGMYVRLAFAVAAHLEPEILVVDEVLAVGDMEFQKKCLGKMRDVATQEHRTVLFVSHNLQAVQSLCDRVILLDAGRIVAQGATRSVVADYLSQAGPSNGERVWDLKSAPGNAEVKLTAVRVLDGRGKPSGTLSTEDELFVELDFVVRSAIGTLCVGFDLANHEGLTVFRTYQTDLPPEHWPSIEKGRNRWRCRIPKGLLNRGDYVVNPRISIHNVSWIVNTQAAMRFRISMGRGLSPLWVGRPGVIAPILQWSAVPDAPNWSEAPGAEGAA
jgi:lipopolysaccharide transport system ATP-binding protein